MAADNALIAMSTRMRKAKVGSCSMVRSVPSATASRNASIVDGAGAAIQSKQRLIHRHEVAHLRDEFDHSVGPPCLLDEPRQIHGEHDPRLAALTTVRPGSEPAGRLRRDAGAWSAPDRRS